MAVQAAAAARHEDRVRPPRAAHAPPPLSLPDSLENASLSALSALRDVDPVVHRRASPMSVQRCAQWLRVRKTDNPSTQAALEMGDVYANLNLRSLITSWADAQVAGKSAAAQAAAATAVPAAVRVPLSMRGTKQPEMPVRASSCRKVRTGRASSTARRTRTRRQVVVKTGNRDAQYGSGFAERRASTTLRRRPTRRPRWRSPCASPHQRSRGVS